VIFSRFLTISIQAFSTIFGGDYLSACKVVEGAISDASNVYYSGDPSYARGIYHSIASSQQSPACVVEPGTPEDVGKILGVIDSTRTPFAVMSGGHAANPGFSSTPGIHIYLRRFSEVTYNPESGTAVIGSGLTWDTVYERLQKHGVSVLGGRAAGVGVGGLLLGGGYSYKTNQYGLAIDTIVGFNLVTPSGRVTYVTEKTHPDLFFGLKGGYNNFGIVTDFTMTAFPQTEVWGGQVTYSQSSFDQVRTAIADFSLYSQDPKAAILPWYVSSAGNRTISHGIFYDGPTPPPGTFDGFTSIPSISSDLKTRSYLDMILSTNIAGAADLRGSFHTVGVSYFSETLLEAIENEMTHWTAKLTAKGGVMFSYVAEPFLQSYLSHANSPSAFPSPTARRPGNAPNPLLVYFAWSDPRYDNVFIAAVEESANRLAAAANAEGLLADTPSALYGNYANGKTALDSIYGENLSLLRKLAAKFDPSKVMSLAGGFRL